MTLIKIYCLLYAVSILLWPSVWTADRFIVPILPLIILFVARGIDGGKLRLRQWWRMLNFPTAVLLATLLLNTYFIMKLAIEQISDNIQYIKGDHYAGYPDEYRQFFSEIARLEGLPDSMVVMCRKPEFVYLLTGRACVRATTEVEQ